MATNQDNDSGEPRGLLSKIKGLFRKQDIPDKTSVLIQGVDSVIDLKNALDREITRNEVKAGQTERDIEKLGDQEEEYKDNIKRGGMNERAKINALRAIKRIQSRIKSYENQLKIFQDNIDVHMTIFNQITEMEAMAHKAVSREQVEDIAVEYDDSMEKHRDFVHAVRSTVPDHDYEDLLEKKELAELEAMIMAEKNDEEDALKAADEKLKAEAEADKAVVEKEAPKRSLDSILEEKQVALEDVERDDAVVEKPRRQLEME